MSFDANKYLKNLDDCDLTDEQKLECIQNLRSILKNFVDAAFGTHPVQLSQKDSIENDLQSKNMEVESGNLSNYFKNRSASKMERKYILTRKDKEIMRHAEPK